MKRPPQPNRPSPSVPIRGEWVGDDVGFSLFLSNGSVFVLRSDDHADQLGIYLPDGTWRPLEAQSSRRMGF